MADVSLLRFKARRCRELAGGPDKEIAAGLIALADRYEAEADAIEAEATGGEDER